MQAVAVLAVVALLGAMVVSGCRGGSMGGLTEVPNSARSGVAEAEVRFSVSMRSGRDLA